MMNGSTSLRPSRDCLSSRPPLLDLVASFLGPESSRPEAGHENERDEDDVDSMSIPDFADDDGDDDKESSFIPEFALDADEEGGEDGTIGEVASDYEAAPESRMDDDVGEMQWE